MVITFQDIHQLSKLIAPTSEPITPEYSSLLPPYILQKNPLSQAEAAVVGLSPPLPPPISPKISSDLCHQKPKSKSQLPPSPTRSPSICRCRQQVAIVNNEKPVGLPRRH
nr:hypothetical protein Iba_chr08aCG7620 [Ipomoea batatas]